MAANKKKRTINLRSEVRKFTNLNEPEVEYRFSKRTFKRPPNKTALYTS
jgi:hypothetical protein